MQVLQIHPRRVRIFWSMLTESCQRMVLQELCPEPSWAILVPQLRLHS
jgi:hypothetical protein